jgi:hypothetical protein
MAIPHKRFPNPELSKVVTLPAPKESAAQAGAARGRRSRRPGAAVPDASPAAEGEAP